MDELQSAPQPLPEQQPETQVQETTIPSPEKKKSKNWLVVGLGLIALISIGIAGIFAYQNYQFKKRTVVLSPETSNSVVITPTSTPIPSVENKSLLEPLDDTWNLYTNYLLGFSIKVPKMNTGLGPCVWRGPDQNDHSYRLTPQHPVPVKIFEEPEGVYLNVEYSYKLTGETIEDSRHFYSGCEKYNITLENLKEQRRTWHIISEKVSNDAELELFIKKHFMEACKLGEKRLSNQDGVYDVVILGDNKPMEESQCLLNFMYIVKYAPSKERAFTWDMGQSASFCQLGGCFDQEMLESFTVLF